MNRISPPDYSACQIALGLALGCIVACAAQAETAAERPVEPGSARLEAGDVGNVVKQLGTEKDEDSMGSLERLHAHARAAAPLLLAELRVVDPDPDKSPAFDHMIWCDRALRSLTGQLFTFKTKQKLTRDQATFLDAKEPMGYFSEWMSRGRIFVAPKDVQGQVIAAWRKWLQEHGSTFEVRTFEAYGDWYF